MTVQDIETALVTSRGGFLARCGMSVLQTGANPDIGSAMATALRALGYASTTFNQPTDADLHAIPADREDLFLGVCDLNLLSLCVGRWANVDMAQGQDNQKLSQLATQLDAEMKRIAADLLERYGYGRRRRRQARVAPITAGSTWPPNPPPPLSLPPYPPSTPPASGSGRFNP